HCAAVTSAGWAAAAASAAVKRGCMAAGGPSQADATSRTRAPSGPANATSSRRSRSDRPSIAVWSMENHALEATAPRRSRRLDSYSYIFWIFSQIISHIHIYVVDLYRFKAIK